jgi:arylsulfatase
MFGNRAIYHDGWLAGTVHKAPWEAQPRHPLTEDVWELYDVRADFSLANDLAAGNPDKLAEMQTLFMIEAARFHVLPIDDRSVERANAALAGRPDLMGGRSSLTLAGGMTGMSENVFLNVKNKSKTITAEVTVPDGGANGAIIVQGGRFGGWALYVQDGRPGYDYNWLGLERTSIMGTDPLPAGNVTIRFEFAYDGGGMGRGGTGTLFVNDQQVAQARIERTQPNIFSADETADVGIDLATPVVEAVGSEARSRFNGTISRVTVEVRDANAAADAAVVQGMKKVTRHIQ